MSAFQYIASDRLGKEKKGVMEASSERKVRENLRDQGLLPMEIKLVKGTGSVLKGLKESYFKRRMNKRRVSMSDLALLTRQFSALIAVMPMEEALRGVAEQSEKSDVREVLLGVRSRVLEGQSLAKSMDEFPSVFSTLYRSTIRAGEKSGELDSVLNRLADYVEKQYRVQQKVRQAMVYPALLVTVSIAILVFLLVSIVPKIVDVFSDQGQSLPAATIALLAVSQFMTKYGLYLLGGLVAFIFTFRHFLKNEKFRFKYHVFLTKVPVIGRLIKTINSARFSRTFGILFAASVPVLDAMQAANDVMSLVPMKEAVERAVAKVREGADISLSLKETGYFSPMVTHLIAVGESTGRLEEMLEKAADQQDQDVTIFIENALTLFEPLMILFMGGMVLFIVLAILLPIFNLDVLVQ